MNNMALNLILKKLFVFPACHIPCRNFCLTTYRCKVSKPTALKKMVRKQLMIMHKMVERSIERETKKFADASQIAVPLGSQDNSNIPFRSGHVRTFEPRRVKAVQHLLHDRITELLQTDEFIDDFAGLFVEITGVEVLGLRGQVNVMWIPTGDEARDKEIYTVLKRLSPRLRIALCAARVLGDVPRLEFVADTTVLRLRRFEEMFAKADFGPLEVDPGIEVMEVTVEASLKTGVSAVVVEKDQNLIQLSDIPEKRTDMGGVNRKMLIDQLNMNPKRSSRKAAEEEQG